MNNNFHFSHHCPKRVWVRKVECDFIFTRRESEERGRLGRWIYGQSKSVSVG
jgi:hypothetical protein